MKKRNCACGKVDLQKDINISSADIAVKKNQINIVITREPDTPLISEIRAQIAELREIGLEFADLDRKIRDVFSELDLVSKTMLLELLEDYVKKIGHRSTESRTQRMGKQPFPEKDVLIARSV